MNDLFATWGHPRAGVVEHLSQAQRQLAGTPGLEAAWALVDAALTHVAFWLAQHAETPVAASTGRVDVERLLEPAAHPRLRRPEEPGAVAEPAPGTGSCAI
ncbi:MAG TPA: hypothetical protein VGL92_00685 [Acidimicrobiia bacterium]|jgi:hypothetical protein